MDAIENGRKLFRYYKSLGEGAMAQLTEEDLLWSAHDNSNSIAIIVGHLSGNMLSRWTDFLTTDGEKDWRNRDREFEPTLTSRGAILEAWDKGWAAVFTALDSVNADNADATVTIRNQIHTIPEAVNRQVAHYAYHVGQIVYIGRLRRGEAWASLSIPKGRSQEFNARKVAKGTHGGHFTDGLRE